MVPALSAAGFGILSGITMVLMGLETNKKLHKNHPDGVDLQNIRPYRSGPLLWCAFLGILAASCLVGYFAVNKGVQWIGVVELGACYLAVLAAAVIDLKTKTIPNYIPAALAIFRLVMLAVEFVLLDDAANYLVSSLVGGLLCMFLLVIANKISRGGIGAGDIKLLSAVGFVCGLYLVLSAMLFSLLGFILVSAILLLVKKCSVKDQLPFGPFIYVGFLVYCLVNLY